jgi:DNA-binding NarL/FixJ family response regulator
MMPMPIRILIADDSLIIRRSLKSELLNAGFEVCGEAEDGRAAVEKTLELKPDLVIIDLVMPKLNGLAASREISRRLPGVPIVMHSVHVLPEHEHEAKESGVSRVVCKSELNIIPVLRELLGRVDQNDETNSNRRDGFAKAS